MQKPCLFSWSFQEDITTALSLGRGINTVVRNLYTAPQASIKQKEASV